jgi:hypothetical protein
MRKFGRSWELVTESFAILKSDRQLVMFPIVSAVSCVLVSAMVLGGGGILVYPKIHAAIASGEHWQPDQATVTLGLFAFYFINYAVIVFFNVALVTAASHKLDGREADFRAVLQETWARKARIFQWAAIAATVGILLQMLERRVGWIGRIVVRLVGVAWALASYFVAPVLAFEDIGPVDALRRSAAMLRKNWGDELVGGFSLGLIFFLLTLPAVALFVVMVALTGPLGFIAGGVLLVLYFLLLGVVGSAVRGIFVAALYRFANKGEVAAGFSREQFSMVWQPK